MLDAQGNETDHYDLMEGIQYTSDDPAVATIVDDDAMPKDARIEAVGLGTTRLHCRFDGDPGSGLREILLESEEIVVVPGPATGGEFTVTFTQVEPT
jgi:hypothetical protein